MSSIVKDTESIWLALMTIALHRDKLLIDLKALAEEQRRMLVEGRHAGLVDNIQAQDQLLAELACLDQQEDLLMQDAPVGLVDSRAQRGAEYLALSDKSTRTAQELKSVVHGNRELFENAMQYVAFSLEALSTLAVDEPSYSPTSDGPVNRAALMLDLKV